MTTTRAPIPRAVYWRRRVFVLGTVLALVLITVNLVRGGGSWAFRTAPDLAQQLNVKIDVPRKLSRAAVETLAIIAYHQPVTRAEVEEIRGVSLSRGTLDVLLEAGWIRPKGRRRTPGRPTTWGTTDGFLEIHEEDNLVHASDPNIYTQGGDPPDKDGIDKPAVVDEIFPDGGAGVVRLPDGGEADVILIGRDTPRSIGHT